jgi:uncharacterized SAM-dependent methyltransferase
MTRRTPRFIQAHQGDSEDERATAIARCRARRPRRRPSTSTTGLGSHLFDAITELPEYYPTRTEAGIFAAHGAEMASRIGGGSTFIDLGRRQLREGRAPPAAARSGALHRRRHLGRLPARVAATLQREHPALEIVGLGMDFSRSPALPDGVLPAAARPVFFYPGSSIGNFTPHEAWAFLAGVHAQAPAAGC